MRIIDYNRKKAIEYAEKWALSRNPNYYDFEKIGGDCTNFASQCLFAGSQVMNYTPIVGWYYNSANDRTASWTGVTHFYNFITKNKSVGPFGREISFEEVSIGDFVQLKQTSGAFHHNLIVVGFRNGSPLFASHSRDAFNAPLSYYPYVELRALHVEGVRTN